jgi:2-polyprenyl-3-methyl-5-hydroxy-6-metoxy-1,4-benzoquinol methylase
MNVAAYFDDLYRPAERYWWRHGDPYSADPDDYPTSLLTQLTLRLIRDREPGRALDLGAGEGADSIRLARMGYTVTAVDVSEVAGEKTKTFAADAGVDVNVVTADVGEYRPEGQFDIVICNGVLHYIRDKARVIRRIQAATRPGGINVVSSWTTFTPVPACHNSIPVYSDDENGVIARAYDSWNLKLKYFERDKPEASHTGMPKHSHSHIKLIAKKRTP